MQNMERVRPHFTIFIATLLLLFSPAVSTATTCVELRPLKPIHLIRGVVFFLSGDRIANAKVTVLQAGKEIAVQETDKDGKFSFEQLKPGNYEVRVSVKGVGGAYSQVVLVHPEAKAKRELAVGMTPSGVCSSIWLVNSKQF
jgi:hypothetical protein